MRTTADPTGGLRRCAAHIDLGAVRSNARRLRSGLGPDTELCAVVKADGYGHGAVMCARAAIEGGATRLAVSTAEEAEEIRCVFPRIHIFVMGPLTVGEVDAAISVGAEIGASSPETLAILSARAGALGRITHVHVKFDSGMGRLGTSDPEAAIRMLDLVVAEPWLEVAGIWTHFATADDLSSTFFEDQLRRFALLAAVARAAYPRLIVHAANSAATLRDPRSHFDMVRCGVALYGLDPFQVDPASSELRPVMSLHSYLAQVKSFAATSSAGYGRSWRAPIDTWVGLVPVGYGDGVRRTLSNRGAVLVGGRRRPIVGTISMDSLLVDLGPELDAEPGDEVVLIGSQGDSSIPAEQVASELETINYEVTCGVTKRVPRHPFD